MIVAEAFEMAMNLLDAQYAQACQDLEATRSAIDAEYAPTRKGLVDACGLLEKLSGNPSATAVPGANATPTKKVGDSTMKLAAPSASASLPAAPKRSTRRIVLDLITDWTGSDKIAAVTGFPPKKIRGVLCAEDLQGKIERRPGVGRNFEYRLKPRAVAAGPAAID